MSDLMFYGVLRMPYEMAMSDELSRRQFWSRAQEAADRVEAAEAELARRAAQPADVGAGELPELPEALVRIDSDDNSTWGEIQDDAWALDWNMGLSLGAPLFTIDQMRGYARDAIAADRRARASIDGQLTEAPSPVNQGEEPPQAAQGVNARELFIELRDAVTECINHERNSKNLSAADYWREILDQFDAWLAAPPLSSEQQDPPINQCDGCRQGAPMTSLGNHIDSNGKPFMYCQKQRYESFGEQQAEKGEGA